jgi:hypothetical protein
VELALRQISEAMAHGLFERGPVERNQKPWASVGYFRGGSQTTGWRATPVGGVAGVSVRQVRAGFVNIQASLVRAHEKLDEKNV